MKDAEQGQLGRSLQETGRATPRTDAMDIEATQKAISDMRQLVHLSSSWMEIQQAMQQAIKAGALIIEYQAAELGRLKKRTGPDTQG